jgi:hypothetical protein
VFDLDADVDEVIEAIIGAYPEFADYTKTHQWKTWDFLPKWFTLAKRRPVASFLLDTAQSTLPKPNAVRRPPGAS